MSLSLPVKTYLKKITWLVLAVFLFSVISITAPQRAHAVNDVIGGSAESAGFTKDDTAKCSWKNASWIVCSQFLFVYDMDASAASGKATFQLARTGDNTDNWLGANSMDGGGTYFLVMDTPTTGFFTTSAGATTGKKTYEPVTDKGASKNLLLATGGNAGNSDPTGPYQPTDTDTKQGDVDYESVFHTYEGKRVAEVCGLYAKPNKPCYSMVSGRFSWVPSAPDATKAGSSIVDVVATDEDCGDSGALNFVLCPLLTYTQNAVESLTGSGSGGAGKGYLVELLTITPLNASAKNADGTTNNMFQIWSVFRDIALGIFILIFIVIIFGNGLGMDSYTIKRALPRLAAGTLFTFASFFIVQNLVDLSNAVGNALPAILARITADASLTNFQFDLDLGRQGFTIILLILFAIAALVATIIGIAGLIIRQVVIYGLVLTAPLAFAAWVLPNTESIFKKWWTNLMKVLMMFPMITGMLAFALLFQKTILSGGGGANGGSNTLQIAAAIAPLLALTMIPKTFKWGGEAFAAGAGFVAGKLGSLDKANKLPGQAVSALGQGGKKGAQNRILQSKNSAFGGDSRVGGFLAGAGVGSLAGTRGARLRRAGMVSKYQGEIEKAAGLNYDKSMAGIKPAEAGNDADKIRYANDKRAAFGKLIDKAPREELFSYMSKAAKNGDMELVGMAAASGKVSSRDYAEFTSRNFGDFDSIPDFRDYGVASARGAMAAAEGTAGFGAAQENYRQKVRSKVSGKSVAGIVDAKSGAQKDFFNFKDAATGKDRVDHAAVGAVSAATMGNLINDKNKRGNLTPDTLQAFSDFHKMNTSTAPAETAQLDAWVKHQVALDTAAGKKTTEAAVRAEWANVAKAIDSGLDPKTRQFR